MSKISTTVHSGLLRFKPTKLKHTNVHNLETNFAQINDTKRINRNKTNLLVKCILDIFTWF